MCEFCNNIQSGRPDWDFLPKDDENIVPSGDKIEIREIVGHNVLVFTNSANEYEEGALGVNYCPICGRKLVE